jgi:predicted DCC family thiol-disulfide oxidoreductase YuxK
METCQIRILYDGECPLCSREIQLLRRLDRGCGCVCFEDIAAPEFDAIAFGLDAATAMERIHGVLPDGAIVEGMAVFRRAYAAVGLGWLLAPTAWPGLRGLADWAYATFARNRLRWTGRSAGCAAGRCSTSGSASEHLGTQHTNPEVSI